MVPVASRSLATGFYCMWVRCESGTWSTFSVRSYLFMTPADAIRGDLDLEARPRSLASLLSVCLFVHASILLRVSIFFCLSVCLSVHESIFLQTNMFMPVCLFVHESILLRVSIFFRLSVCLSTRPYFYEPVFSFVCVCPRVRTSRHQYCLNFIALSPGPTCPVCLSSWVFFCACLSILISSKRGGGGERSVNVVNKMSCSEKDGM